MELVINGEETATGAANIKALLHELGITSAMVAVELNEQVVRKCDYHETSLKEGDAVEIVNFVGGG